MFSKHLRALDLSQAAAEIACRFERALKRFPSPSGDKVRISQRSFAQQF
jgi:hypothetical protein